MAVVVERAGMDVIWVEVKHIVLSVACGDSFLQFLAGGTY
jgi:hypothetical protein